MSTYSTAIRLLDQKKYRAVQLLENLSETDGFVVYSAFIIRAPKKVYTIYIQPNV